MVDSKRDGERLVQVQHAHESAGPGRVGWCRRYSGNDVESGACEVRKPRIFCVVLRFVFVSSPRTLACYKPFPPSTSCTIVTAPSPNTVRACPHALGLGCPRGERGGRGNRGGCARGTRTTVYERVGSCAQVEQEAKSRTRAGAAEVQYGTVQSSLRPQHTRTPTAGERACRVSERQCRREWR
jgi:hypothetical protein